MISLLYLHLLRRRYAAAQADLAHAELRASECLAGQRQRVRILSRKLQQYQGISTTTETIRRNVERNLKKEILS